MKRILASLLLAACSLAACSALSSDPAPFRQPLKYFISEQMRARGLTVTLTDDDPLARPPTKYAAATKDLAYTIRHSGRYEESPVTLVTWVYKTKKARDAAKEPFAEIPADHKKHEVLSSKWEALDGGDLHIILFMESPNTSLGNQFELLMRAIRDGLPSVKAEEKK